MPCINPAPFKALLTTRPIKPEAFKPISDAVREVVPSHLPVGPSQCFGVCKAELKGKPTNPMCVVGNGYRCLTTEALDQIRKSGLQLQAGKVEIIDTRKRKLGSHVWIIQVDGVFSLGTSAYPTEGLRLCDECGRHNIRELQAQRVSAKRSSLPKRGDVFGVQEWAGGIYVTDRFREMAAPFLNQAQFQEVQIVEE